MNPLVYARRHVHDTGRAVAVAALLFTRAQQVERALLNGSQVSALTGVEFGEFDLGMVRELSKLARSLRRESPRRFCVVAPEVVPTLRCEKGKKGGGRKSSKPPRPPHSAIASQSRPVAGGVGGGGGGTVGS